MNNPSFYKSLSTLLVSLLLLGLAVVISFSGIFKLPSLDTTPSSTDWFMRGVVTTTFSETGDIKGILKSKKLVHHPASDTIDMTQPFFIFYDKGNIPWHIKAKKGTIYHHDKQHITLKDHVVVRQLPGQGSNNIHILTSVLTYYPDTHIAQTDQPATITEPESIMHSVGFIANLKEDIIYFLSRSEIEYHDTKNDNPAPTPR